MFGCSLWGKYRSKKDKIFILRSKIIICFIVLFSTQDLYSSDTISKRVDRNFYKFLAVEGAVLTGAISYLKNEWYSDKKRVSFHFYNAL